MSQLPRVGPPIYSDALDDPDMIELVMMFVDEMPARADVILSSFSNRDWKSLAGEAHKLRGSAGGHGFQSVGDVAGTLEDTIRSASGREEAALANIQQQVNDLINLCRRVSFKQ